MTNFVFVWRDDNGNNAYAIFEAGSLPSACGMFYAEHGREFFALFQGSNIEMREFIA